MKASEAPEKIYLQVCGDCNDNDCENCKFEDLEDNVTWCKNKIFDKDIEYVSTDAFIEKSCKWLRENINNYTVMSVYDEVTEIKPRLINDFKKAMTL